MQRSIRFPDDLDARIAKLAANEDRSFSWVVLRTLEKALGRAGDSPVSAGARAGSTPAPEPPAPSRAPASEEAPAAASGADESPSRPTPPRGQPRTPSPLAARQQALNKSKGM